MLALMLMLAAPQDAVATARALTRAEVPCRSSPDSADITVCGRRQADRRYRISFVLPAERDSVPLERDRLLDQHPPACGMAAFLANCGFVGVTMTSGAGGTQVKTRKLAP
ncbi:hypothetical protein M9980_12710 [Sphingomonas donggukensis]|uniref:Uncharacterized protein n=1 Tax=Sphingomonas donggukensis TaxID=2949093 RepID=A0ABY4TSJ1_9SPHN|nr:hypothetical protein [Sphingomonas donggukensis]URW75383.1 hypothetical protein M9980_12710 [Sphingomonas donggukensis]